MTTRPNPLQNALPELLQAALYGQRQKLVSQLEVLMPRLTHMAPRKREMLDRMVSGLTANDPHRIQPAQGLALPTDGVWPLVAPRHDLNAVVLPAVLRAQVDEIVHEHQAAEALEQFDLAPRHRILLHGSPGNGKTLLAEGLAHALDYPFLVVNYGSLISSNLGNTARNLDKVFAVADLAPVVLFFDELDSVGNTRTDDKDIGEMRRIVNQLMLRIDRLPSHAVLVGATNLFDRLDPALVRRFELVLELPSPLDETVHRCVAKELDPVHTPGYDLRVHADAIVALKLKNLSAVVNLCRALRRDLALHAGANVESLLVS